MISLNDILWGGQLGDPDDENTGDGTDPSIKPQAIAINCLAMCCITSKCRPTHPPCATGIMGCK